MDRSAGVNRRFFMKQAGSAAMVAGAVNLNPKAMGANERVILGLVGAHNRGWQIGEAAIKAGGVFKTFCDIDDSILRQKGEAIKNAQKQDVKLVKNVDEILDDPEIDAVMLATPDHWHAIHFLKACQAGKDIYCEKPLSHTLKEGQIMRDAARKYNRIVQVGTQRRSNPIYKGSVEYAASGKLGDICFYRGWSTNFLRKSIGRPPDEETPEGVDYDQWLGPAPKRAFNSNRFHYKWRYFWDYGTSEMGNLGVHALDICIWAIQKIYGMEKSLPKRITCTAGKYWLDDDKEIPDTQVVTYDYGDFMMEWLLLSFLEGFEPHGQGHGAAFYGTEGAIVADRGLLIRPDKSTEKVVDAPGAGDVEHAANFLECVKSRGVPNAELEIGRLSSTVCLLGNVAYHLGRDIRFDPQTETCIDDAEANALMTKEYREPYTLPVV